MILVTVHGGSGGINTLVAYDDDGDGENTMCWPVPTGYQSFVAHSVRGVLSVNDLVYVADEVAKCVKVYDQDGACRGKGSPEKGPVHLVLSEGVLYTGSSDQILYATMADDEFCRSSRPYRTSPSTPSRGCASTARETSTPRAGRARLSGSSRASPPPQGRPAPRHGQFRTARSSSCTSAPTGGPGPPGPAPRGTRGPQRLCRPPSRRRYSR